MKKQIALVSVTLNAVNPMTEYLSSRDPELHLVNYLDSYLLEKVGNEGGINDSSVRRMFDMLSTACADGADGVILTCTIFSPYVQYFPACCPDRWCVRTGPCWTRPRDVRGGRRFSVPLPEPWILPGICTVVSEESADCRRRWTCTWWMGLMRRVNGGISLPTTA